MMDRTFFQILSEQQMVLAQQKAHALLIGLKEDVQWSKYCSDGGNSKAVGFQKNPVHYVPDQSLAANKPTESKKDISVQVTLERTLPAISQKKLSPRKDRSRQEVFSRLYPTRPCEHSNLITESLQEIRQRITDLQLNIGALKENKISRKNDASCKSHESLKESKNSGVLLDIFRSTIPKQIGFQVPYILQEQRALEKRRKQNLLKQVSAYQSYKKQNALKSEIRPIRSQTFRASGNMPRKYEVKKKRSEVTKADQPARETRSKNLERLIKKNAVVSQSVSKAKAENGNASILSLQNKLAEIEEREKQVNEILKSATTSPFIKLKNIPMEVTELQDNSESFACIVTDEAEPSNEGGEKYFIETQSRKTDERLSKNTERTKNQPHRTELYIEPSVLESIHSYKSVFNEFSSFITSSSQIHFNPFALCERISDSILEDCFQDVAEEMENVFSSVVMNLYDEEFHQS